MKRIRLTKQRSQGQRDQGKQIKSITLRDLRTHSPGLGHRGVGGGLSNEPRPFSNLSVKPRGGKGTSFQF